MGLLSLLAREPPRKIVEMNDLIINLRLIFHKQSKGTNDIKSCVQQCRPGWEETSLLLRNAISCLRWPQRLAGYLPEQRLAARLVPQGLWHNGPTSGRCSSPIAEMVLPTSQLTVLVAPTAAVA